MASQNPSNSPPSHGEARHWSHRSVRAFHAYATWLVGLSWVRFGVLSLLLLIVAGVLNDLPPFNLRLDIPLPGEGAAEPSIKNLPQPPSVPDEKADVHIEVPALPSGARSAPKEDSIVEFSMGEHGISIKRSSSEAASAPASPDVAASGANASGVTVVVRAGGKQARVVLPPGADTQDIKEAIDDAKDEVKDALNEARDEARDARKAANDLLHARNRQWVYRSGEGVLPNLAFFWIVASIIIKISYKGRMQAEAQAARAEETAESELLRRQVIEARMAAMQAQVEPHFLFNTLASIDHLIETDPPRASQMQKHLIALLRAAMPGMRGGQETSRRALGQEMAFVQPYVALLKMRMEERLDVQLDVPEGLYSAEFPAMALQTLVENAIRHGLEPKPEGGRLRIKAEIVHGRLQVVVADTGVGFGASPSKGTGVGLSNIRERLRLLHGDKARLVVAPNSPTGAVVTLSLPYRIVDEAKDGPLGAVAPASA